MDSFYVSAQTVTTQAVSGQHSVSFDLFCGKLCNGNAPLDLSNGSLALDLSDEKFCNVTVSENLERAAKDFGVKTCLLHGIPEKLRPSFNYATWAQNAQENGDIWVIDLCESAVAVFYKKTDGCKRCLHRKADAELIPN